LKIRCSRTPALRRCEFNVESTRTCCAYVLGARPSARSKTPHTHSFGPLSNLFAGVGQRTQDGSVLTLHALIFGRPSGAEATTANTEDDDHPTSRKQTQSRVRLESDAVSALPKICTLAPLAPTSLLRPLHAEEAARLVGRLREARPERRF
jgi:hypothetical protein